MSMKLISTTTLGSDAANIEFTNIPQTYTDLFVLFSVRSAGTNANGATRFLLRPNNSSSNGSTRHLEGSGSAASSGTRTNIEARISSTDETASTFSNGHFYITNYTASTAKSISADSVYENNATEARQALGAGLWDNSAAITSLVVLSFSGNLVTGSTVSLYGITKGSDGVTTAS